MILLRRFRIPLLIFFDFNLSGSGDFTTACKSVLNGTYGLGVCVGCLEVRGVLFGLLKGDYAINCESDISLSLDHFLSFS